MKKLFLINIFILLTQAAYASDWLSEAWREMTTSSSTKSSSIATQNSHSYVGGTYNFATKNTFMQPLSVRAPSISAGCSGISLDMGAFQYNEEQIINFLKSLLSAAPGYAFQLAMQILCPACTDLMNTLNEVSSLINGMQLDSCSVLQAAGGALKEKLAHTSINSYIGSGESNWFNGAVKKINDTAKVYKDVLGKIYGCSRGDANCPINFVSGDETFIELLVKRLKKFNPNTAELLKVFGGGNEDTGIDLLRAAIGDIKVIEVQPDVKNDDAGGPTNRVSQVIPIYLNAKIFVQKITFGRTDITAYSDTVDSPETWVKMSVKNSDDKTATVSIKTFNSYALENLSSIKQKFSPYNRTTPLTGPELQFLASFKSPVYKTLNKYSIDAEAVSSFVNNFRYLAGAQLCYEFISQLSQQLYDAAAEMKKEFIMAGLNADELMVALMGINDNLRDIQQEAYKEYAKAYDDFSERMRALDLYENLLNNNRALMARHPVMGGTSFVPGL